VKTEECDLDLFDYSSHFNRWNKFGLKTWIGVVLIITWFPVFILSFLHRPVEFLFDVTVNARFLIALPLLLISPYVMKQKFRHLARHFIECDIVKDLAREKFYQYIQSTSKLGHSFVAKAVIWIIVYLVVLSFALRNAEDFSSSWLLRNVNGELSMSPAGLWFTFIGQPIYSYVQLYFLYKGILWWRFLFLVSCLDLQLRASHGDDTGGLIFLGESLRSFRLPVLAFSVSIAAGAINLVLHKGFLIEDLKFTVGILLGFSVFLFVFPLIFFFRPLLKAKQMGVLSYGRLGAQQLEAFENKWLYQSKQKLGPSLIESGDFSNVADSISIVNKVYNMRVIPVTRQMFLSFVLIILLPFLPVFFLTLPWKEMLKNIFMLLT
jgi:hypothetical protein